MIDKQPAVDPTVFPISLGMASDVATLLDWVIKHVPPRLAFGLLVAAITLTTRFAILSKRPVPV